MPSWIARSPRCTRATRGVGGATQALQVQNLEAIRQWYLFWNERLAIAQQPVAQLNGGSFAQISQQQLSQVPWGHNLTIVSKCESIEEALCYVQNTIEHGWSRSVLTHQIEGGLWQREGKTLNNFTEALVSPQSDLAAQTLKDPYIFDFLTLTKDHNERELEAGLVEHITHFLLELGAGFAYIGRQVSLQVLHASGQLSCPGCAFRPS